MFPTKDDITKILVKNIIGKDKKFEDLQESWFTKHLIIALREAIWMLILIVEMVYKNLTVIKSTGDNLDDKGYDFGVDRKQATKAIHSVTLHKSTAVKSDLIVPDKFLLTTTPIGNNPPIKFEVIANQNLKIKKGESYVENVLVECTEYGEKGNVSNNAINLVAQAGFDYVTDSKIYTSGTEKETDNLYRARILERKRTPARAGVPADWERWALEVSGISYAKCFRCARGPGTADIVVWGDGGTIPAKGVIEKCQKYFDEKYTPADLADGGILVTAPEIVEVDITITNAILKDGYSKERAKDILKNAFNSYFITEKEKVSIVDCIVCARTAFDLKDAEQSPILEDFVLVKPNKNIKLSAKQSAVVGVLILEVKENE